MPVVTALPTKSASGGWSLAKFPATYSHRDSCRIFKHAELVYLSNGYQPGSILIRDLWRSADAIEWELVNNATPYTGWCPLISFNGTIVALGLTTMRSTDGGVTFTTVGTPPFVVATDTISTWWPLVRDGTLFLFGADKTWWTTDLVTWSSRSMPFYRNNFAVWDIGGSVYIAGGNNDTGGSEVGYPTKTSFNDVWRVSDPKTDTWTRILAAAPWSKRMWPGFCVHGDDMIITGGYNNVTGATNFNDTWASRDGTTWRQLEGGGYSPRHFPSLVSIQGRCILNNGNRNPNISPGTINDVWELN